MDDLFKHLGHMPRIFKSDIPVESIGFLYEKKDRIQHDFKSYNFSFILRGRGDYILRGKRHEVIAPCVITQWPDEPMDYGPDKNTWFEVYFIYGKAAGERLKDKGFFSENHPIWHISDPQNLMKKLRELQALSFKHEAVADRADLICEAMIMESLLAKTAAPLGHGEDKIRRAANMIRKDFVKEYDYEELAESSGMSLSTFRRLWLKYIGMPPAKYRSHLLLQEACRMIVESEKPMKEIASELGFDDQLYFSRRFHKLTGETPTDYRRINRPPHLIG